MQISLETRDVFIEVTSTDRHKGDIVLSTLCAMYSAHCAVPFQVEPVEVTDALGAVRGAAAECAQDQHLAAAAQDI